MLKHIALIGILMFIATMVFFSGICDVRQDREEWMKINPEWRYEVALNIWESQK
jgi:hypothetical protein